MFFVEFVVWVFKVLDVLQLGLFLCNSAMETDVPVLFYFYINTKKHSIDFFRQKSIHDYSFCICINRLEITDFFYFSRLRLKLKSSCKFNFTEIDI